MRPINAYLERMIALGASDLYFAHESPAAYRIDAALTRDGKPLTDEDLQHLCSTTLSTEQQNELHATHELNTALSLGRARFRLNVFHQQHHLGMVIRHIRTEIPNVRDLGLPGIYEELAMEPRGLVLIAGPTGSGKSTSLASMIGFRNRNSQGHIITVEDPVEFTHEHMGCVVTQRDVGLDTLSFSAALKNALRQRPDVVAIGEIRDREVMEQAMYFAETGHLCIATIHAGNAAQAIERAINLFPERRQLHVRHHLSIHLLSVLAQRLILNVEDKHCCAFEVLLNRGLIRQLIEEGKTEALHDMIAKGSADGMVTMDATLLALHRAGTISEETALAEAENPAQMRMLIRQKQVTKTMNSDTPSRYKLRQSDS